MNSHQSLAEALEMCKYTENFTSHGARWWRRGDPSPNPPNSNTHTHKKDPFPCTVASLDTSYCEKPKSDTNPHQPASRTTQHQKSHTAVTSGSLHPPATERQKASRFTSHAAAFGFQEKWGGNKNEALKKTRQTAGSHSASYFILLTHPLTRTEDEQEYEKFPPNFQTVSDLHPPPPKKEGMFQ